MYLPGRFIEPFWEGWAARHIDIAMRAAENHPGRHAGVMQRKNLPGAMVSLATSCG
jgi:hypothetical protein